MRPYLCIPLRGTRGGVALVSERYWPLIDGYRWYQSRAGYAFSPQVGLMHRRLVAAEPGKLGEHVDHRNFNKLDNRHENLRCCSQAQNNLRSRKRNTPWPYKGIRRTASGKWQARIKQVYLGSFNTAEAAAGAYDDAARKIFGHFACCNFGVEE
jgi:hypothetical protein